MKRLLGVDFGDKSVGLAISDLHQEIVYPYQTIHNFKNLKNLFSKLKEICEKNEVGAIIWGLPLGIEGDSTPQSERLHSLAKRLQEYLPSIPIFTVDESFSSFEADEILKTMPHPQSSQHELAAMIILKNWIKKKK